MLLNVKKNAMCSAVMMALAGIISVTMSIPTARAADDSTRGRYVEIPINGDIGFESTPSGLAAAVENATQRFQAGRVNTIVLTIQSEGGSDIDALMMGEILANVDRNLRVVAAVDRALGPALALVLACDELVILSPQRPGPRLQYQAPLGQEISEDWAAYRQLNRLGPLARLMIDSIFEADTPIYVWRNDDGQKEAATTPPDNGAEVVELPPGALADGMNSEELQELGIPTASNVAGVGQAIGDAAWTRVAILSNLMRQFASDHSASSDQIATRLDLALSLTMQAKELEASLIEREALARGEDPRRQPYQYRRTWRGNRIGRPGMIWGFNGPTQRAWQANSDRAIAAWGRVVRLIDQIFQVGGEARDELTWLTEQTLPTSMGWVADEIAIIEAQLRPLLSREGVLMNRRAEAVKEVQWFEQHRRRPVM